MKNVQLRARAGLLVKTVACGGVLASCVYVVYAGYAASTRPRRAEFVEIPAQTARAMAMRHVIRSVEADGGIGVQLTPITANRTDAGTWVVTGTGTAQRDLALKGPLRLPGPRQRIAWESQVSWNKRQQGWRVQRMKLSRLKRSDS